MSGPPREQVLALLARGLAQPDARSCGAASMVVARMLQQPAYAETMDREMFRTETLRTHGHLTSPRGVGGVAQLPWPRALGTPPWAVRRELARLTGLDYRVRQARLATAAAWSRLEAGLFAGLPTGAPVALYVGSRWLPRHVVLAMDARDGAVRCYEPGSGHVRTMERDAWTRHVLRLGWPVPWAIVAPVDPRR